MALPEVPLINGIAYSWSSIRLSILGAPLTGITAINYSETEAKEDLYGVGRYAVARGYGNVSAACSISMYKDTLEALQRVAPNGRIQDIPPFDIPVIYINKAGKYCKDVIRNVEFNENKVATKQGENGIVADISCICSHIDFQQ